MEASVRVAGNRHGMGGLGRVRHTEFQKQNYGLRMEWICSNGLGTNSGQGEVGSEFQKQN